MSITSMRFRKTRILYQERQMWIFIRRHEYVKLHNMFKKDRRERTWKHRKIQK